MTRRIDWPAVLIWLAYTAIFIALLTGGDTNA